MNTNKKTLMPQSYLQAPIFNISISYFKGEYDD